MRRVGYCLLENGAVRPLLKVRNRLGLPDPSNWLPRSLSGTDVITDSDLLNPTSSEIEEVAAPTPTPSLADFGETPRLTNNELGQIFSWALRYSAPVNLGSCEGLTDRVPQAFVGAAGDDQTGVVGLVDSPNSSSELTDTIAVDAQEIIDIPLDLFPTPTPEPSQAFGAPGVYVPTGPVLHDQRCAGQYVRGVITNRQGEAVAGVRLILRDQWGNQYDAVSKNGATDTGSYDFPIYSYSPHQLYLTVVDNNGTPLSPTISILHLLGESDGKPCHWVNFVGG